MSDVMTASPEQPLRDAAEALDYLHEAASMLAPLAVHSQEYSPEQIEAAIHDALNKMALVTNRLHWIQRSMEGR